MKMTINLGLLLLTLVSSNLAAQTQDCRDDILETTPVSRFTINNDGTVTDTQTDLIWARCPQGLSGTTCATGSLQSLDWAEALALNGTRPTSVTAGPADWRLPNIKELTSLVERACRSPAINATIFPNNGNSFFWSASPSVSSLAWGVNFIVGNVNGSFRDDVLSVRSVRLVRGGQ